MGTFYTLNLSSDVSLKLGISFTEVGSVVRDQLQSGNILTTKGTGC